jgi:hypothetical protein
MKNIKLILFLICCVLTNAQQKKDSIIHISSHSLDDKGIIIKQKISDIILSKEQTNLIKEDKLKYINRHFYINEILDKSLLEDNSKGIFVIIPSASHSPYYLLLLDNDIKIVDFKVLNNTILEALNYFNKRKFSEELRYKYLMEILKYYKINKNTISPF